MKRDRMFVSGLMRLAAYVFISSPVSAHFVAPVPGLDASDIRMRNQLSNIGLFGTSGSADERTLLGDEAFAMQKAAFATIDDGEWETALDKTIEYLNATRNSSIEADVNRASLYLTASMLSWNIGRKSKAKEFLEKSIRLMRTGEHIGGECEIRAVKFLEKVDDDELPSEFTVKDMQSSCGIHGYIMELPYVKFKNNIAALCARYETVGRMADSWKGVYEAERRHNERMAKQEARDAYSKVTGDTFSLVNPPDSDSSMREHWETANRIYDIFGK